MKNFTYRKALHLHSPKLYPAPDCSISLKKFQFEILCNATIRTPKFIVFYM